MAKLSHTRFIRTRPCLHCKTPFPRSPGQLYCPPCQGTLAQKRRLVQLFKQKPCCICGKFRPPHAMGFTQQITSKKVQSAVTNNALCTLRAKLQGIPVRCNYCKAPHEPQSDPLR